MLMFPVHFCMRDTIIPDSPSSVKQQLAEDELIGNEVW